MTTEVVEDEPRETLEIPESERPVPTIRQEAVMKGTGRPVGVWFHLLDAWPDKEKGHAAMAKWLRDEHGQSLWWSQMITVLYERARGMRKVYERADGFATGVTRRIEASPQRAWDAIARGENWMHWLSSGARVDFRVGGRYSTPDGAAGRIASIRPLKRVRLTWEHSKFSRGSYVIFELSAISGGKVTVGITHARIGSDEELKRLKKWWGEALNRLRDWLEEESAEKAQLSQASSRRRPSRGRT